MFTKNGGELFYMKEPSDECTRNEAHSDLSCSSCHSSWAPSCIGCHNSYDKNEPGYDMVRNKEKQGSWVEYIGQYDAKLPALGKRLSANGKEIIPVVPGMVLTIDMASYSKKLHDSLIFQRLFAPSAPHTTSAKGRSCMSCHNSSVALGYGEGKLNYKILDGKGKWIFEPLYENSIYDNLPLDAWTGFMQNRSGNVSTRTDVFPFSVEEQKKILTVGACLTCHGEKSDVMKRSLNNFSDLLNKRSAHCILPNWE